MSTEFNVTGDIILELEEAQKLETSAEDSGVYSITRDFGGVYSIICC